MYTHKERVRLLQTRLCDAARGRHTVFRSQPVPPPPGVRCAHSGARTRGWVLCGRTRKGRATDGPASRWFPQGPVKAFCFVFLISK